ncbi:hypothetical protein [[Eubacterium] cellulosolvens]
MERKIIQISLRTAGIILIIFLIGIGLGYGLSASQKTETLIITQISTFTVTETVNTVETVTHNDTVTSTLTFVASTVSSQVEEQIVLDAYDWSEINSLTLNLRNVGDEKLQIEAIYVGGVEQLGDTPKIIRSQDVQKITVSISSITPTPDVVYTVKVVTATGVIFTFSCIAGHGE